MSLNFKIIKHQPTAIYAVINIGSKTIKCEFLDTFGKRVGEKQFETMELGRDLKTTGNLNPEAVPKTIEKLKEWLLACEAFKIPAENIRVIATAAIREAKDTKVFIDAYQDNFSIPLKILSQDEEAHLGIQGMLRSYPNFRSGYFLEMGGASGQFGIMKNRGDYELINFKIGIESLKGKYKKELDKKFSVTIPNIKEEIKKDSGINSLSIYKPQKHSKLVLTGGIFWKFAYYHLKTFRKSEIDFFEINHESHPELSPLSIGRDFEEYFIPMLSPKEPDNSMEIFKTIFEGDNNFPDPYGAVIALCALEVLISILNPEKILVARGAIDDGIIQEMIRPH